MNINELYNYQYCKAVVEDNNDPDKLGKVQVRLIPLMIDADELPWYDPWNGTSNSTKSCFDPPEIGSIVHVLITSNSLRNGYYLYGDHIEGFFDYASVKSSIDGISEASSTIYPNVRYQLHPNGNITFYNQSSGDQGILHNTGSYIIINGAGKIVLNSKTAKIKVYNDLATLKDLLDSIQSILNSFTGAPYLSTSPGAPVSPNPAVMPGIITNVTTLQTSISNLLE